MLNLSKHASLKMTVSALILSSSLLLTGCGYNTLQAQDEQINASWAEVVNQYQRRADLIPNLVKVVGEYAKHEQQVLTQVAQARASAGSVQVSPEMLNDPNQFQKYQQAQDQLGSSLSRLLMVSERYPELKADKQFQDLQAELSGTESRIAVARKRYIDNVQAYNTTIRQFPSNMTAKVIGMQTRPQFSVANEQQIAVAPTVDFSSTTPAQNKTNP